MIIHIGLDSILCLIWVYWTNFWADFLSVQYMLICVSYILLDRQRFSLLLYFLGLYMLVFMSLHENKKAFSQFYKKYFWYKMNVKHPIFVLPLFSIKNIFYYKIDFKGCVRYICASLFCMSKREHLRNKEKYFLFHFESSSRFWDNQILTF